MNQKRCAYCGVAGATLEKEHVFPKCLYPPSKSGSKVQRMTVPACAACNRGWSKDEAHFRNMLLVAGEPNPAVHELWQTKAIPSFHQPDGFTRAHDLLEQMRPVTTGDGDRYAVFPGEDERVMRVIRKVIRGLCHYHHVTSAVSDQRVWADVLTHAVPIEFRDLMTQHHREHDIVEYGYVVPDDSVVHSAWLLTFFERRTFIGVVFSSEDAFAEQ